MQPSERRDFGRLHIEVDGTIKMADGPPTTCKTRDISYCGALLRTDTCGRIGARVTLTLPHTDALQCRIVRVLRDGFAIEFDRSLSPTDMLKMLGDHCDELVNAKAT